MENGTIDYTELAQIVSRPEPFSAYTADELWTDPHTSRQMLAYHLNSDVDVSSRKGEFISRSVEWLIDRFRLNAGKRLIDFGCGPGLYTSQLAKCGACVTGVDFSSTSIAYAREQAEATNQSITYHHANYLEFECGDSFDLITMIMCDFCALSPAQRAVMLRKFADMLSSDGHLVFDVYSTAAFEQKQEVVLFEKDMLNGFWSAASSFCFMASFKYHRELVSLDKYTIIEANRQREVFNWLQYYSPESLTSELEAHGLEVKTVLGSVAGDDLDAQGTEFAVVVKKVDSKG